VDLRFGGNLAFFATEGNAVLPYLADVSLAEFCQVIFGFNLGEGGLCLNCEVCTFPNCGFGK
jgi:hypothetical protein